MHLTLDSTRSIHLVEVVTIASDACDGYLSSSNTVVANDAASIRALRSYYQNVRGLHIQIDYLIVSVRECGYAVLGWLWMTDPTISGGAILNGENQLE